ncbi:MAG: hypothetical protein QXG39_00400 [Candidatus Aenigmatarchaeota archaeon]
MVGFTMQALVLKRFLELVNIETNAVEEKEIVKDAVLNVKNNEIICEFSDDIPYIFGRVKVTKGFSVLEEGVFGFADISKIIDFIKLFEPTDRLKVVVGEESISIEREVPFKKITIPKLKNEEIEKKLELVRGLTANLSFDGNWKGVKFEWKNYFDVLADRLTECLADAKVVGGRLIFPITIYPDKVEFKIKSEDGSVVIEKTLEVLKLTNPDNKKISSAYYYGVDGVFDKLDEKIRIWVAEDNSPMILERLDVGDGLYYMYILPPIAE